MAFSDVVARLPWLHGHPPVSDRPISQLPRSMVLVLDDEAKLRAAVERAIRFERGVALRTADNISRYEQMAGRQPIAAYRASDADTGAQLTLSEQPALSEQPVFNEQSA